MKTFDDILKYSFMILKLVGLHPETNKTLRRLSATLYLTSLIFLFIIVVVQTFLAQNDVFAFVYHLEAFLAYVQIGSKAIFTLTHKREIFYLTNELKWSKAKQWNFAAMPDTERVLESSEKLLKLFGICIAISGVLIMTNPLFTSNIPIGIWKMEKRGYLYIFVMVIQEIGLIFYIAMACCVDGLLLSIFICTIVRYRFLHFCLRKLSISNIDDDIEKDRYYSMLKKYTKYHVILQQYTKELREAISPVVFIIYVSVTILLCAEMYIFLEGSSSDQLTMRRPIAIVCLLAQLSFYCIPATFIANEAIEVSDAAYESNWTSNYFPGSRKALQLLIQQAQQPITFTAGGLVDINAATVISVLKVSWSTCTIIRALKDTT